MVGPSTSFFPLHLMVDDAEQLMEDASYSRSLKGTGGGENRIKPQFQNQPPLCTSCAHFSNSHIGEAYGFEVALLFGCRSRSKGSRDRQTEN
jgi:hypothetical protein